METACTKHSTTATPSHRLPKLDIPAADIALTRLPGQRPRHCTPLPPRQFSFINTNLYKFCEHRQITGRGTRSASATASRGACGGHAGSARGLWHSELRPRSKRIQFGVVMRVLAVFLSPPFLQPLSEAPFLRNRSKNFLHSPGKRQTSFPAPRTLCALSLGVYLRTRSRVNPLPLRWSSLCAIGKCLFSHEAALHSYCASNIDTDGIVVYKKFLLEPRTCIGLCPLPPSPSQFLRSLANLWNRGPDYVIYYTYCICIYEINKSISRFLDSSFPHHPLHQNFLLRRIHDGHFFRRRGEGGT